MGIARQLFQKNSQRGSVVPLIFLVIVIAAGAYYYFGKNTLSIKLLPKGAEEATIESEAADTSGVNEINDDPENTTKSTAASVPQSKYASKSGLWNISYPVTWRVDGAVGESATFSNYGENTTQTQKPIISVAVALSDPAIDFGADIDKGLQAMNDDLTQTYTKEPITVTGGKGNRVVYYDKTGQTKITKVLYIFPLNIPGKKVYLVGRVDLLDPTQSTYKPGLIVADSITLNLSKASLALQNK